MASYVEIQTYAELYLESGYEILEDTVPIVYTFRNWHNFVEYHRYKRKKLLNQYVRINSHGVYYYVDRYGRKHFTKDAQQKVLGAALHIPVNLGGAP